MRGRLIYLHAECRVPLQLSTKSGFNLPAMSFCNLPAMSFAISLLCRSVCCILYACYRLIDVLYAAIMISCLALRSKSRVASRLSDGALRPWGLDIGLDVLIIVHRI